MKLIISIISLFLINNLYAGGISSGGGDTLPKDPASVYDISYIVENSKLDLILFLKSELLENQTSSTELSNSLYKRENNIFDILEEAKIKVEMDKPCFDFNGRPVDGSVNRGGKDKIVCISAFRTAPKLSKHSARIEILALIIHELSHFLGTSEEEADRIQKGVLYKLRETSEYNSRSMVDSLFHNLSYVRPLLKQDKIIDRGDYNKLFDYLSLVHSDLLQFSNGLYNFSFLSIFDGYQDDYQMIMHSRFIYLMWYVAGLTDKFDAKYWSEEYINLFAGDNSRTYSSIYKRNTSLDYRGLFGKVEIKRINSAQDLKDELLYLHKFYSEVYDYLFALNYRTTSSLPEINLPENHE